MRMTIELDEALPAKAQALTGQDQPAVLVREALAALIERESARHLARPAVDDAGAAGRERRARPGEEQTQVRKKRPFDQYLADLRAAQKARGHVPPTRAEVDRYLAEERAS